MVLGFSCSEACGSPQIRNGTCGFLITEPLRKPNNQVYLAKITVSCQNTYLEHLVTLNSNKPQIMLHYNPHSKTVSLQCVRYVNIITNKLHL